MKGIVIDGAGGPEVLKLQDVEDPSLGEGEVIIKVAATAVNRADTMQRQGKYPPPKGASLLPGLECSGTIEAVGHGVTNWKVGDQVREEDDPFLYGVSLTVAIRGRSADIEVTCYLSCEILWRTSIANWCDCCNSYHFSDHRYFGGLTKWCSAFRDAKASMQIESLAHYFDTPLNISAYCH